MASLDDRVDSALIASEFRATLATGKIGPNTTIYWLIEKESGVKSGNARKIIEGFSKTGPKSLHTALQSIRKRFESGKGIIDAIEEEVQQIETMGLFPNRRAFADYVEKKLRKDYPDIRSNLRDRLFYHRAKFTAPWHFGLLELLKGIRERKDDANLLQWNTETYQALLRFAYNCLLDERGMNKKEVLAELSSVLGIAPATIYSSHMYGKGILKGKYQKLAQLQAKILHYIQSELIETISIDIPEGKVMEHVNTLTSGDYHSQRVLFIASGSHRLHPNKRRLLRSAAMQLKKLGYQVRFAHEPQEVASQILNFNVKPRAPIYTVSPTNPT